jgi:hypothetical protein
VVGTLFLKLGSQPFLTLVCMYVSSMCALCICTWDLPAPENLHFCCALLFEDCRQGPMNRWTICQLESSCFQTLYNWRQVVVEVGKQCSRKPFWDSYKVKRTLWRSPFENVGQTFNWRSTLERCSSSTARDLNQWGGVTRIYKEACTEAENMNVLYRFHSVWI